MKIKVQYIMTISKRKTQKSFIKLYNGGFIGNLLTKNVLKQVDTANELHKKGITVIKTPDMKIGKKYRPVLSDVGYDEFTLTSLKLDDFQSPMTDPDVRIIGKTYIIMAKEWWFSDLHYANEWFIEIEPIRNSRLQTTRRTIRSRKA